MRNDFKTEKDGLQTFEQTEGGGEVKNGDGQMLAEYTHVSNLFRSEPKIIQKQGLVDHPASQHSQTALNAVAYEITT